MLVISRVKAALVPPGERVRTIPLGLFRGQRHSIDLRNGLQFCAGLWERELAPWMRRFAEGARTAVDVGCGNGCYSLFFQRRGAHVLAIDCTAEAEREFRQTLALNGANIEFRRATVGARFTLDSLLPMQFPALVKIDIEGGECDALRGASRLLREDVRWIVETHSKAKERECMDIFASAGVPARVIPNAWWRAFIPEYRVEFDQNRWIVAASASSHDQIAAKARSAVAAC